MGWGGLSILAPRSASLFFSGGNGPGQVEPLSRPRAGRGAGGKRGGGGGGGGPGVLWGGGEAAFKQPLWPGGRRGSWGTLHCPKDWI